MTEKKVTELKHNEKRGFRLLIIIVGALLCLVVSRKSWNRWARVQTHRNDIHDPVGQENYHGDWDDDPVNKRITFIFLAGTEGAGHHFYASVMREISKYLQSWGMRNSIGTLASLLFFSPRKGEALFTDLTYKISSRDPHDYGHLFKEVVQHLMKMKNKASVELVRTGRARTAIPINCVMANGAGMMSYPNFGGPRKDLQAPNLALLYRACDVVGVHCKHVIMFRDPYEVIRSTTVIREFSSQAHQITLLKTMVDLISSAVSEFPDRTAACWDYNKPDRDEMNRLGKLIGSGNATEFYDTVQRHFEPHEEMRQKERDELVPKDLRVYMSSFQHASDRLKRLCKHASDSFGVLH